MLAIGLVMKAPDAKAALLPLDGSWVELVGPEVSTLPTEASPYTFAGGPWTMSSSAPVKLTVTDWIAAGDLFQVWNNGSLFGVGSSIEISGAFAATPDLALGNSKFSQNSWLLQPGNYSFSFKSTKFAPTYTNGTVAFKAEQLRVPDSGTTVVLLGVTLAGIAGLRASRCAGARGVLES